MRAVLLILGIILGAAGGTIAYRAAFISSPNFVVTSTGDVHQLQNVWHIAGGLLLLIAGALLAFFAARRRA